MPMLSHLQGSVAIGYTPYGQPYPPHQFYEVRVRGWLRGVGVDEQVE